MRVVCGVKCALVSQSRVVGPTLCCREWVWLQCTCAVVALGLRSNFVAWPEHWHYRANMLTDMASCTGQIVWALASTGPEGLTGLHVFSWPTATVASGSHPALYVTTAASCATAGIQAQSTSILLWLAWRQWLASGAVL
jgi:hypothetical protein